LKLYTMRSYIESVLRDRSDEHPYLEHSAWNLELRNEKLVIGFRRQLEHLQLIRKLAVIVPDRIKSSFFHRKPKNYGHDFEQRFGTFSEEVSQVGERERKSSSRGTS
jgi:hypothetical protein